MRRTLRTALAAGSAVGLVSTAQAQFPENFDAVSPPALPAGWTTASTGAGLPWATVTTGTPPSLPNAVFTNDRETPSVQTLDAPALVAAGPVTISLKSSYTTESTFDGWVVKYSVNGGAFNLVNPAWWQSNGPTVTISTTFGSSLGGQLAFSGTATAWTTRVCVIPANAGDSVVVRFHMESDTSASSTGVWLDDINVSTAATAVCCMSDGTCQTISSAACASGGGTFSPATSCATAGCPAPGACCMPNGSCVANQMFAACAAAGGIYQGAFSACGVCSPFFGEAEPNETKAQATSVVFTTPGQTIMGYTTGTATTGGAVGLNTSQDTFLVTTPAASLGVYRNRLAITSTPAGHTGTLRGLNQTAPTAGTWPGPVGTIGATDSVVQTTTTLGPNPRTNQWYGFGKQEQVYFRVTGATTTTQAYTATFVSDPITPTDLGSTFQAGMMKFTTVGQGHTTDTDLWLYDSNFNPIDGCGNDGASTWGGAAASSTQSNVRRQFLAGTYYLALANTNLANNKPSPCDDTIGTGIVLDFPNAVANSSTTTGVNVAFAITDGANATTPVAATRSGVFDVTWFKFTVIGSPPTGACCKGDGTCADGMTEGNCLALGPGNVWQGSGSLCSGVTCPTGDACCLSDATCVTRVSAACVAQGGVYQGAGVTCGTVNCPHRISTTIQNNGTGGVFINLTANASALTFNAFATYFAASATTIEVYSRPGTYVGFDSSNVGWTLTQTVTATGAGTTTLKTVPLTSPISLPANTTTAIYLQPVLGSGFSYTGTAAAPPQTTWTNSEVTLFSDVARTGLVSFGGTRNTPRTFAGTIFYDVALPINGACCNQDGTCTDSTNLACQSSGGIFRGAATTCGSVTCTGACCKTDGSCSVGGTGACTTAAGTFAGYGSTCATANCPPGGACCKFDGTCAVLTQALCVGAWGGQGTTCAGANCPTKFFQNCNLPTGTTTLSGVAAPAGSQWSEVPRDDTSATMASTNAGYSALAAFRESDDFTVPAGGMNVSHIRFAAYQTGASSVTINNVNLQLWNGAPNGGGAVVFGDTTTNRIGGAEFAPIYRCFNTVAAATCGGATTAPDQTRHIQWITVPVNQTLAAGTYWWDVQMAGSASFTGPWIAAVTDSDAIGRVCTGNNPNSLVLNAGVWTVNADIGQGCTPVSVNSDLYFEVYGTASCYANCDASTQPPILNVADFTCFLQKYAAGDPYANCDSSTQPPVLNVADFTCFLQKYAAGCT